MSFQGLEPWWRLCRRPTNWTKQARLRSVGRSVHSCVDCGSVDALSREAFQAGLGFHGAAVAEAVAGVATRLKRPTGAEDMDGGGNFLGQAEDLQVRLHGASDWT